MNFVSVLAALGSLQEPSRTPLLDHRQVQVAMIRIATEHQDLVQVIPVGSAPSRGGRKIEALRLSAGTRGAGRPAILLVAGLDGARAWTSGLALDHASRLAAGYASDPEIKAFLDSTTLYVIPRANPDATEARGAKPLDETAATGSGVDNDRDGRQGEDPPGDVDGDGLVTWMRVPDPAGEWMADPADPRAMIRADRKLGQRGLWNLVREGRDSDGDEKASEDAEHDAVVNRNFPNGWKEHAPESGLFATDEPEARSLCDFVLEHRDIAFVLVYGELDDFSGKPKTSKDDAPLVKRMPPEGMPETDAALLEEIGKRRAKLVKEKSESEGDDDGTFQAWCRFDRGLWTAGVSVWSIPLDAKEKKKDEEKKEETASGGAQEPEKDKKKEGDEPKPSDDAKRLRWVDEKGEAARFVPWRKFQHPELGEVEIGGWTPYAKAEPPESEYDAIAQGELDFLVGLAGMLPRVVTSDCTATDLGGGVWEIEASIGNGALLPLASVAGRRSEVVRPARVSLEMPAGARLVAGKREELVRDLAGSGGRKEFRWLVSGTAPVSLAVLVETDSAGATRTVPEVK
ncbi:MAG: M14 family zinc carboxypeptidase [Planctomycetota bacterium]